MTARKPSLTFIGGTGDLGSGLAWRFAMAGYPVIIGSRAADKAEAAAAEMSKGGILSVQGMSNADAAQAGDIVFMTVPFANHEGTLASIREGVQEKIFVDSTVPLMPPKVTRVQLPASGCVAKQTQDFLGENVRVVSAFQNVAAAHLQNEEAHLGDCDVLVTGNDVEARDTVVRLASEIGFKAWHAGPIENSAVAEALTSVLIFLNKRYGIAGAGIHVTGTPTKDI
ncbi:NADPH-dependent F420 reductase [Denitratisoma oestradiolicum]|uniref:F420-dependent NADP reductase n=1 Tax=Denitratisoma oestradiolicum TaxID=311182 RepID=A0A6S6YL27_9PROT|nr:NADPH-dependent F420 reductase [Denitratisoma oestradiolicum]TWO79471.1 NADPH-dependent F420 reductase [Denitratisoma oestradiolicum]CAB1368434.1 F420-dependent NADP reductase [Denitratisoma oestradiolicum]